MRGGGRDRIKSRSPPPDEIQVSHRPMSLTESELQAATLDILAEVQPTRSLPATPLSRKRPVDFDETPPPSPISRTSVASPALTLDSVISSATSSPAHATFEPEKESEKEPEKESEREPEKESEKEPEKEPERELVKEPEPQSNEELPPPSQTEAPPIIVTTQDDSHSVETKSLDTNTLEPAAKKPEKASTTSTPELPEFLRRKFVWDEIQEVLDSLDEREDKETYDELPPEEPVWLEHSTGVEQLRAFMLTCP